MLDLTGLVLPSTVEESDRSTDGRRAEYVLQPLERGFGHTVGNSMRRLLLSSLPGSAIWAFRADGVQHEHQTIHGVVEDVHRIIQNLKSLVIVMDPGVDEAQLQLSVTEAGTIRASSIGSVSGVTIVNPEQIVFTLQEDLPDNRPLHVDFWVNRGRGFVVAEMHEKPEDLPVDLIRIDSIYNPVLRANFVVQETRVGQRTDFDRLTIQVETDGSIEPGDALAYAAELGQTHLGYLLSFGSGGNDGEPMTQAVLIGGRRPVSAELCELLDTELSEFDGISIRSRNNLDKADVRTLFDVVTMTRDEVLNVPSFGEKSLEEVAEVVALNGLRFAMRLERDEDGKLWVLDDDEGASEGSDEA